VDTSTEIREEEYLSQPSEGGHWYTTTGESCYEVEKVGGGLRPTTLRDARKLNLYPSVTGIMAELAAPALEMWKIKQAVTASRGMRKRKDETDDQFAIRANAKAKEKLKDRASQGTNTHDNMERYFLGEEYDERYNPMITNMNETLDKAGFGGVPWGAEKSFATDGFGGKVDLHADCDDDTQVVLDFKTKEDWKVAPKCFENHYMQIAAYRYGLGMARARGFIMFLNEATHAVHLVEIKEKDLQKGWAMFSACLLLWQAKRGYYPMEANENIKC
jgi:hypothetical protein